MNTDYQLGERNAERVNTVMTVQQCSRWERDSDLCTPVTGDKQNFGHAYFLTSVATGTGPWT